MPFPRPREPIFLHRTSAQPTQHYLRPEHQHRLRELTLLLGHHQALIAQLQREVAHLLALGYGVNLDHECWTIDLETGVVMRQQRETQEPEDPHTPGAA